MTAGAVLRTLFILLLVAISPFVVALLMLVVYLGWGVMFGA